MKNNKYYKLNICGFDIELPIIRISPDLSIAFFNLHGNVKLTEHCAKHLAALVGDADVILTAESKGLQLAHCVARNLGHDFYAVARKSVKLYMTDYIKSDVKSITTENIQTLYLSGNDKRLLENKKVAIIDDVVSTGASLDGLKELVEKAGGTVHKMAFVLAEGDAKLRDDILFLDTIPLL